MATAVSAFPSGHPEFAAVKPARRIPGRLRFNHAVHLKDALRGPAGPEKLRVRDCHKPKSRRRGAGAKGPATTGLMAPVNVRAELRALPSARSSTNASSRPRRTRSPDAVRAFVQQALVGYIREHPGDIWQAGLGVPPRAAELPAAAGTAGAQRAGMGRAPRRRGRADPLEQDLRRMPRSGTPPAAAGAATAAAGLRRDERARSSGCRAPRFDQRRT